MYTYVSDFKDNVACMKVLQFLWQSYLWTKVIAELLLVLEAL